MTTGIEANCSQCGGIEFVQGFMGDLGQGSQGFGTFVDGTLERGIFGGAKGLWASEKWVVEGLRCRTCGHIELFAREQA